MSPRLLVVFIICSLFVSFQSVSAIEIVCDEWIVNHIHTFEQQFKEKTISGNECHMNIHMATREIVQQCGNDTTQEYIQTSCRNAMIHGSMEGASLLGKSVDEMLSLCSSYYPTKDLLYSECVHGIGNGLVLINELDYQKAIRACEHIDTPFEKDSCITGVYGGLFRYAKDSFDPTRCVQQPHTEICLLYVGRFFDHESMTELERCSEFDIPECHFGLGVMISRNTDNDIATLRSSCQTKACLQGALWEAKRVGARKTVFQVQRELLWR